MPITMKERPILFSGPMVRAILEGRKTKTRRIVKTTANSIRWNLIIVNGRAGWCDEHGRNYSCPYGQPGDRLWVRETWAHEYGGGYLYRASHSHMKPDGNWKPSIHMPRAASRILLEITSVRVERLQDISEEDAVAEGVEFWIENRLKSQPIHYKIYYNEPGDESTYSSTAKCSYETLWQSINGPESWNQNPFVWVIEFKRI